MTKAATSSKATTAPARVVIEIGPGELVDRLSILDLKVAHAPHAPALLAARDALAATRARLSLPPMSEEDELASVNADLWAAEDAIRRAERRGDRGPGFTALARKIMELNDRRSALKALIDHQAGFGASTEMKIYDR